MVSSGMLRRVALVGADVSEELSTSFIRVARIGELGTTLALTSNRGTLRRIIILIIIIIITIFSAGARRPTVIVLEVFVLNVHYGVCNGKRIRHSLWACMREQPTGLAWGTALDISSQRASAASYI
jgi:hypothetical protein